MSGDTLAGDFDSLEVGGRFQTRARTITETDLVSFAALTGDFHPIHTDVEWAAASEFNGRIAHGMLLLSYCVGLVPLDPAYVMALRGFERITFKRPVRIGDTIHVDGTCESKVELDEATGLVVFNWKIVNQRGETTALAKVRVVWRREPELTLEPAAEIREQVYL